MADPIQLSASVDVGFSNSTPGSGVAQCGLGDLADSFLLGAAKGAVATGAVLLAIALLPEEAVVGTTIGLGLLGAYGAVQLARAWNGMNAIQKAGAAGEVAGGFAFGGAVGFAESAAARSAGLASDTATSTALAGGASEEAGGVSATAGTPPPAENTGGVPGQGVPAEGTGSPTELTGEASTTEPPNTPEVEPVPTVKTFTSFKAFEEAANNPQPNTTYKYGSYEWTTDSLGRTIEARGTVNVQEFGRNNPGLQRAIGNQGKSTDVGFHLIADSLDGPTTRLNVVPGNGKPIGDGFPNLNQGPYKSFENTLRDLASDPANTVEVSVEPRYSPGNTTNRPDEFIASYRTNGGKWNTRKLINK